MNLFNSLFPEEKLHKNYWQILKYTHKKDRMELLNWCKEFPDRDNKFVKEFQITFNSSFWEIYLYALFKELDFKMNWENASPDFHIFTKYQEVIIEATIASNALGKTPEWDADLDFKDFPNGEFRETNRESIIRLANSITSKTYKYRKQYSNLQHVKNKPFVLAVAPFEQPHFNIQYDVPITSLLFDYYVDEDAYNNNPHLYPNGPPGISLKAIEKDNGALIKLGFFEDDSFSEISAIIFSTTATWGKVEAMSKNTELDRHIFSTWFNEGGKEPELRKDTASQYNEKIRDGLMVFHNPYANIPLNPKIFERDGIMQVFVNKKTRWIDRKKVGSCLMHRSVVNTAL